MFESVLFLVFPIVLGILAYLIQNKLPQWLASRKSINRASVPQLVIHEADDDDDFDLDSLDQTSEIASSDQVQPEITTIDQTSEIASSDQAQT